MVTTPEALTLDRVSANVPPAASRATDKAINLSFMKFPVMKEGDKRRKRAVNKGG
jgi:hypothetical protein